MDQFVQVHERSQQYCTTPKVVSYVTPPVVLCKSVNAHNNTVQLLKYVVSYATPPVKDTLTNLYLVTPTGNYQYVCTYTHTCVLSGVVYVHKLRTYM